MTVPLWRQIQRQNFTRLDALADFLQLAPDKRALLHAKPRFALNLPRRLAEKIPKNTLDDPILRQFVPLLEETVSDPSFQADPVGDLPARKSKKLLHKYQGRALLLASSACAMNCRFCFRQNFPYETAVSDYSAELALLEKDPSIQELILSGGDPLSLSYETLHSLLASLSSIPHIKRIRFHTRFPIGIPERLDEPFLASLAACPKQIVFVVHTNHLRELDEEVFQALARVQKLGIPLLTSSVLLKGVNDDEETLFALFEALVNRGILPYYLNLLDKVLGSNHFDVSAERGKELLSAVKSRLCGYGIPRLIREEAGKASKTFIF